jgi:glutamine synthetase
MSEEITKLKERATKDGVEFYFAMFVDMHGKPCAKMIPVSATDVMVGGGAGFAGFAAGPMGQTPADADLIAIPDLSTYTVLPWKRSVAVVMCDIYVEGEPWPYCPRLILKDAVANAKERGYVFKTGTEAEYFLVNRKEGGGIVVADPLDRAVSPCYDAKALTRMYDVLATLSKYMNELGWGNYATDHEDANGQFEQNFDYADALTSADRLIFFRYMVHMVAHDNGMAATFMPKPFSNLTGNGLHFHSSLWDSKSDRPLFFDGNDKRGLGVSALGYSYIAGLLDHARGLVAVTCPTVNSYKRMGVGPPASGSTWAPAYASYGGNNRTQMLRIPTGGGRVENRAADGSANPYLAMAAQLVVGLDGIERNLDPGEPNMDNLYALSEAEINAKGIVQMPRTLLEAVEYLKKDDVLRKGLGMTRSGFYADYFAEVKRNEFLEYHRLVSDWEVDRYLTLF